MNPFSYYEHFVSVTYHPENESLKIIWKGLIDAGKLRDGYLKALEILKTQKVKRCLIDLTQRTLEEQGTQTVITTIFGQALTIIREPLFVAQVLKPEAYFMMTDHFHYDHLQLDDNHYIIIKHFLKQADAEEWLSTATESFHNS